MNKPNAGDLLDHLLDHLEAGVVVFDREGKVLAWNRTAAEFFGTPAEQVIGQKLEEIPVLIQAGIPVEKIPAAPQAETLSGEIELAGPEGMRPRQFRYTMRFFPPAAGTGGGSLTVKDVTGAAKRLQAFEAIKSISRQATQSLDISSFLEFSLTKVAELFRADSGAIYLYDPKANLGRLAAVYNVPEDLIPDLNTIKPGEHLTGKVLSTGESLVVTEFRDLADANHALLRSGHRSGIAVPLMIGSDSGPQRVSGTLGVSYQTRRNFEPDDLRIMETVAAEIALVLETLRVTLERAQALADLSRTAKTLAEFLQRSADGIIWLKEGKVIFANPAALALFRLSCPEEIIGQAGLPLAAPEDQERVHAMYEVFQKTLALPGLVQVKMRRTDGSSFSAEVTFSSVVTEGGSPIIQIAIRDISKRVEYERKLEASENKYRFLVELAPQAIISIDLLGNVTFANLWASELLGYCHGALPGQNLRDLAAPDWFPVIEELFLQGRVHTVVQEEVQLRRQDGKTLEVMINAGSVVDEPGRLQGYIIFIADLSETKSLREQLYFADKMTAIGRLAGGIAHEFNNINAAIQGYVELLIREPHLTSQDREDLEVIRTLIRRATQITQQLLVFARRDTAQKEYVSLPELTDTNVRLIRQEYESEGIIISVHHHEKLPLIKLNPGRVGQLIMELIINARDAIRDAGREKRIELETGSRNGLAFLKVTDTGAGIPLEDQKRIFEPFFTTKGALGGSLIPGTGLGLSMASAIVSDCGGVIEVHSSGPGAVFTVWLPLEPGAQPQQPTRITAFGPTRVGARLLIVDDEQDILRMLERALRSAGYLVETATRGKDALKKLAASAYDAILLDLQMPDLPGEKVLEEVMNLPEHIRPAAIIITGKAGCGELADFLPFAVAAIVRKPFSLETVFKEIYAALLKKSAADAPGGPDDRTGIKDAS